MSATAAIRHAEPRDAADLARVHVRTWQVAYRGQLPDALLDGMSAEIERRTASWQRFIDLATERRWTQLVAEEEGRLVGFATMGPLDSGSAAGSASETEGGSATGELYAIYVDPDHWDHGHGRELMNAAVEQLARDGYDDAVLWVLETNARARRFYEIAGWRPDGGRKTEQRGDVPLHEIRYRRALRAPRAPHPDGGSD